MNALVRARPSALDNALGSRERASMAARVAVVLSGCGFLDGAEIQEAVLALYFLDRAGARVQCFAPSKAQMHVVDHLKGEPAPGQTRDVLQESARIARGKVQDLSELSTQDFDALVLPGGFGVAKNLSTFATQGAQGEVDPELARVICSAYEAKQPIAAICIAPAILAMALSQVKAHPTVTIGQDPDTAKAIESLGLSHQVCQPGEIVVDAQAKVVTTPAYMLDSGPKEVGAGIEAAIEQLLRWVS